MATMSDFIPSLLAGIVAAIVGLFSTLAMLSVCITGSANLSEREATRIQYIMLAILVGGLACLVAGIVLLCMGRGWTGATVASLPTLTLVSLLVYFVSIG